MPAVNRIARTVVYLLVTAQFLLAVPAFANTLASATSAAAHCADMLEAAGDEPCPCCPDGADTLSDCMSACAIASALPASLPTLAVDRVVELVRLAPAVFITSLADPPLNPPPII